MSIDKLNVLSSQSICTEVDCAPMETSDFKISKLQNPSPSTYSSPWAFADFTHGLSGIHLYPINGNLCRDERPWGNANTENTEYTEAAQCEVFLQYS